MPGDVPCGYSGKILRINLSGNSIKEERKDNAFYRRYLGGSGFVSYFLLREMDKGTDPLGPGNKLVFALGPATGTAVIASGRHTIGAKSPLSGGIALSHAGEFWGVELKRAGYDALIVEGKADKPVYISINGDVTIRDAGHLWGKNTKESQDAIRSELGDEKVRVALIGPGGENMVRYACIMHGLYDAAGRGGLGAVMGSKNLKAIAVRGHTAPQAADPDAVRDFNKWFRAGMFQGEHTAEWHEYGTGGPSMLGGEAAGDLPIHNWRDGVFPGVKRIHGGIIKDTCLVGMDGCFNCPLRCKKQVKVDDPYSVDPAYGGPEYESLAAFGSNCGVDNLEAILKANELCNAYSIDVISAGGSIAFAMECFERGLLSLGDTSGMEIRFGSADAVLKCIELIARKEGFGALLAEGTARMARQIGQGSEEFAMQVKGVESGLHEPRLQPSMGLGFMINPHGADHCCNVHDVAFATEARMDPLRPLGFNEAVPVDDMTPRKIALFKVSHLKQVLMDSLTLCHLAAVGLDYSHLADMAAAVTGWDTGAMELIRIAERIVTMTRLYNLGEGFTSDDDRLPFRYFQPRNGGALSDKGLDRETMDKAKRYYYTLMGWDENGVPLPEKVEELYIE